MKENLETMDLHDPLKDRRQALRREFELVFDDSLDLAPEEYVYWLERRVIK